MLSASTGNTFEDYLKSELDNRGFNRLMADAMSPADATCFGVLTKAVRDTDVLQVNPFRQYRAHYIEQPNGTQSDPDFLILECDRVFALETKFNKNRTTFPMWNAHMPKKNYLYLYASSGKRVITFFRGGDVVTDAERAIKEQYRLALKELEKLANCSLAGQAHGFSIYGRLAVQQKGEAANWLDHPNRELLESSAIAFLEDSTDGPEIR